MEPQSLSSGRPRGTKLFPNRSGRVAYPLDCARQLVLGHAEMPRPIFNVIILLDNDFAAVRDDCVTDHGFYGLAISENGLAAGSFRLREYVKSHTGGGRLPLCVVTFGECRTNSRYDGA
jgi:hypothetical protein